MRYTIRIISYIGLALTLIPSFLVLAGTINLESCKFLMLIGTIGWFISAPSWMNKN